jgi:tetratricopeptide (TPR) repeat protein
MAWIQPSVDNERSWAALEQSLNDIHGPRIYVLVIDPASAQRRFVESLRERFPDVVAHQMRETDLVPLDTVEELLADHGSSPLALYGFEWWTRPGGTSEYRFFRNLNMQRSSLRKFMQAPLLIILSSSLLPDLMHEAADYFSTVSGTFRFEFGPEGSLEATREAVFFDRGSLIPVERLRQRRAELGERLAAIPRSSPPSRDQCLTESALGETLAKLGEFDKARGLLEEALRGFGKIRQIVGDTAQALRDESIAFDNAGNVLRDLGDAKEALSRYEKSLTLRREIRGVVGETPEALRDESISLSNTADVLSDIGEAKEALSRYEQSLMLASKIREIVGDTPQSLRDESVSLDKTANVLRDLGEAKEALAHYEQSLSLRRKIRDIVGDTPQALRDESVSLDKTANVLLDLGEAKEALSRYEQSFSIRERLVREYSEIPQYQMDLDWVSNRLASLREEEPDPS